MKKSLLITCFSIVSISAFAQFPDAGSKGFTFGVYGLQGINLSAAHTGTLQYKFYSKDDFIWRFSGVLSTNNYNSSTTGTGRVYENDQHNTSIGLGIGAEKVLAKVNKFQIYGGLDLVPMYSFGSNSSTQTIVDQAQTGSGLNGDFNKTVSKSPSIISIGLYPFLGFEYFISKNFSIGAEFSFDANYAFDSKSSSVQSSRTNGIDAKDITNSSDQKAQFNFNSTNGVVMTGSVYF